MFACPKVLREFCCNKRWVNTSSNISFVLSRVQIRLWSRPAAIDQTLYALSVATSVLEYYESFFNICYPLPKQGKI